MGGGQMAIVMILGGLLLVYGGATGRLGAAWGALKGGATKAPDTSEDAPPAQLEEPIAETPGGAGPHVAMVSSVNSTGQLSRRPGGFVQ